MLVIIDGLDASGKSSQAQVLARKLRKRARTVCVRSHPSVDNFFGIIARQFLHSEGKSAHFASALFYMFDVVRSILLYSWQKFDYLIFVRYLMGTAYLPSPWHKLAYYFFAFTVPTSDFMFFLDVPPKEAERRIRKERRNLEMFENTKELNRIRWKALSLAVSGKWTIIDAGKSIVEVQRQIAESLFQKMEK